MAREPLKKYQTELSRYGIGLGGIGSPSKARFDVPLKSGSIKRRMKGGIGSSGPFRTIFAEEGPASGGFSMERGLYQDDPLAGLTREESMDLLKSMGIDLNNPTLAFQSMVDRAKKRPESILSDIPSDVGNISELAKAYAKIVETDRPTDSSVLPSVEDILSADPSVFSIEGPEITRLKKENARSLGISGPKADELIRAEEERKKAVEDFRAKEAKIADMQGMRSERVSLEDIIEPEKKDVAVEDAFLGGMSEYYKALAQDVPEVSDRKELLQKYMKEFSEATGVPIEGKVDKSQALMAMGLALMQNRAGKGFNVGRMLSSVGEAGQAAMPYLTKAKDEAKQARIAAGKYALQKIESDEDAVNAIKSANRALYNDLALENIKHENDMQKEILKAELEGNEPKKIEALKSVGDLKIRIGSQDILLKRGANLEDEGRVVWQDPVGDSKNIATAYRKTTGGLNSIARMNELLDLMAEEAEGQPGGTAVQGLLDKAREVAVAVGMDLGPYTGGEDVSPRVQYEKLSNALLANFKRYLTSETGNGISTYDVTQIEKALGKFGTFDDIKGAKMALNEIMPMFTHSLTVLEPLVEDFSDRNQYRKGVAGDEQYNDVMTFLSREFGKTSLIQPTTITQDDGTVITQYDVSY